ncbi:CYTH domain-containing protein [uncultured Devosia sp.]|uniref:CYTH domain-containing protein n=1 Tax=uncultured Devosia sp. TaxID=211434 RepID=UPI0035CC4201
MGREIERKFIVTSQDWRETADGGEAIEQGYLSSNGKATVRVRIFDDKRAIITLKGAVKGITRAEFEYDIPLDDAHEMMEMARPHVLAKRRHKIRHAGLDWVVDVFSGRHQGLVLAEIELEHEAQAVPLPSWAGREVSDDDRYYNASLSQTDAPPQA